ncbi:hypothetical protein [Nocardioides sp. 1609]|uniref:hypothetical protein n=1 Tax=Nocardioides sp. 1609 TaxID=2508327 RepID=UPI0010705F68|nr:hypothetical protein [Nocardioides sp. 1609]
MRSRPIAAAAGLLALTAALAACSGDDEPAGPRPTMPTEAPALWNPCDGLDTAAVSTAFGATFDTRTGTAESPLCSFTPQEDGGPAMDVNYQLFAGSLDDLMKTFGVLAEGATTEVTTPEVPDADDVRLIVDVTADDTLAVTAFVQTGDLVQVVNALDPSPFDRAAVVRGVRTVMAGLATHAAESDLTG